jgi:hypothetical protein
MSALVSRCGLLFALQCCALAQGVPDSGGAVRQYVAAFAGSDTEMAARAHDALLALGPVALAPLLDAMAQTQHAARPRLAAMTERILLRCAAPGREMDRRAAADALQSAIRLAAENAQPGENSGEHSSALRRQWVRWLGMVSSAEEAGGLIALCGEQSLAEEAANALFRLDGSWREAAAPLFNPEAPRMAEIAARAAGEARDRGSIASLRALAEKTGDEPAARAAHEALAKMGAGLPDNRLKHSALTLSDDTARRLGLRQAVASVDLEPPGADAEKITMRLIEQAHSRQEIGVLLAALLGMHSKNAVALAMSYLNDAELHGLCRWLIATAPQEAEDALRKAYAKSHGGTQAALLEALHQRDAASGRALAAEAIHASEPEPRLVAARLLGVPADAGDALSLARSGPGWLRSDALRMALDAGHAAVIRGEAQAGAAVFRTVLHENFPAAWNESLEALGLCGVREDEPLLRRFEDISECRNAAQMALANLLARTFPEGEARPLLEALTARAASDRAAATAAAALEQLGAAQTTLPATRGYILEWRQLGPFAQAEGGPPEDREVLLAATTFAPLEHAGERYAWVSHTARGLPAQVIAHEQSDALRVFAAARVPMPVWTPATIEIVAPGDVSLWLNEKPVALRGKRVDILLEPGNNRMLLRLDAVCGGCGYGARLLTRRGAPLNLTQAAPPPDIAQDVGLDSATLGTITEKNP